MKLDLKELLAKITGQTEFKTLLWTNPSPTVDFAAQSVSLDLSKYDEVEVQFMSWTTIQNLTPPIKVPVGKSGVAFSPLAMNTIRMFTVSTTGISFTNGTQYTNYNTWAQATDNAPCIPYKIYGIRYVGGVVRKLLKALKPLTLGRGCVA